MNGAENLLETLTAAGIEVCFANPGTSEMHLVSAIGNSDRMRPVLCLFEGVASGAADGYARMLDKPALTLLHLGSGFANSMANQHNAKRAHVPLVNMVGDHATYHLKYDAPLTSDVAGHARLVSDFVSVSESADDLARAGAEAVQAADAGPAGSLRSSRRPTTPGSRPRRRFCRGRRKACRRLGKKRSRPWRRAWATARTRRCSSVAAPCAKTRWTRPAASSRRRARG